MAKKKQNQQQQISPEKFLRTRGRSLPIMECIISKGWEKNGWCQVLVARKHESGNVTYGIYSLDTFCLGVKDAHIGFNYSIQEYNNLRKSIEVDDDIEIVPYEVAHNLIFGAIDYAKELEFMPDPTFGIGQYLLEEDTDDIPLIEYEFGRNGKPVLVVLDELEANRYLPPLRRVVGKGNYDVELVDGTKWIEDDTEEDYSQKVFLKKMEDSAYVESRRLDEIQTRGIYSYSPPDYPAKLDLKNPELISLYEEDEAYALSKKTAKTLLALPRETLIADLEHLILFEIGKGIEFMKGRVERNWVQSALLHALFLLGELRATASLGTVLEVMRQSSDFMDVEVGDYGECVFPLTIYYLGAQQLPQLMSFMKEPHLDPFSRVHVAVAVRIVADHEPDRREEVIEWFRELLNFFYENKLDSALYDANLAGMIIYHLIDIHAKELLPEIKRLYDAKQVELFTNGKYEEVEKEILSNSHPLAEFPLLSIPERYERIRTF